MARHGNLCVPLVLFSAIAVLAAARAALRLAAPSIATITLPSTPPGN